MKAHRNKHPRLAEIRYKPSDVTEGSEFGLGGIQLVFTQGFETPMYEATSMAEKNYEVSSIKVDKKAKKIAKIGIFWFKNHVCGIRLINKFGDIVADKTWYSAGGEDAKFEMKDVPEGAEIIGIKCNNTLSFSIPTISFIIWEPRNTHKLEFNPLAISVSRKVLADA